VIDFVGWCECESRPYPFQRGIIPGRKTRWLLDCSQAWAVIRASLEAPPICPLIRPLGRQFLANSLIPHKVIPDSLIQDPSVPDGAMPSLLTAANQIPIWNDGTILASSSDAVEAESATSWRVLERANRKIAHDIVDGVIHSRRHSPYAEELERSNIMVTIWTDLQGVYYQARAHGDSPEIRLQIAAQCAARLWKWVREKGKQLIDLV
jgi:hypothetical protein